MKLLIAAIAALTIALIGFRPSYGGPNHEARQKQTDALNLTIFKEMVARFGPKSEPKISFYCVALDKDRSSERRLIANLEKAGWPTIPFSSCEVLWKPRDNSGYQLIDKKEKKFVLQIHISRIHWLSDKKAVVQAGHYAGSKNASSGKYTFLLTKKGWVLSASGRLMKA